MHKEHPKRRSQASPKTWAELCQNTFLPSGWLKSSSSSLQLPSNGRSRSQSFSLSPSSLATTVRLYRELEIPLAISPGVVSHAVPSFTEPSGMVMEMGSRGFWAYTSSCVALSRSNSARRSWRKEGGGLSSNGPESSCFFSFFAPLGAFGGLAAASAIFAERSKR